MFNIFSENFHFRSDEHVILYVRRHWIFIVIEFLKIAVNCFSIIIAIWLLQYYKLIPAGELFGVSLVSLTDIFIYMWLLFCWLLFAEKITDYLLNFWVVTNRRIVEGELLKLFDHKISTLELQDIEDITIHNQGFWSNYFNYGRLDVQTAGSVNEFFAEKVTNPEYVQKVIFDAKLADDTEKKRFEVNEIQKISQQVLDENKIADLNANVANNEFNWAKTNKIESINTSVDKLDDIVLGVEDKYKKGINDAIKFQ